MAVYSINYDLVNPGRNYDDLIAAIKTYSVWCHPLESCWLIKTEQTSSNIYDYLSKYLDSNDKILVMKASAPATWKGLDNKVSEWIKNNLH